MIQKIVIENFKSFKKVELALGRLNIFIGANAIGDRSHAQFRTKRNTGVFDHFVAGEWRCAIRESDLFAEGWLEAAL